MIQAMTVTKSSKASLEVWHQRMGHPQTKSIKLLQDKKFIEVSSWMKSATVCVSCQLGKSCKLPFGLRNKISSNPLDKIHCDLWGPAPNNSTQGYKYYAVFIDDHTRYTWLYPLRRKSDFFECFLKFQILVENQLERRIKIIQSDGGGEFQSIKFQNHLSKCGILQQVSCPGTPEQNGVAERKHRHIVEMGLTMLFNAKLPLSLWVDAFLTAVYLINRLPSTVLKMESPFFMLFEQYPEYRSLRIFGC